jgi:hypothetical protein
LHAVRVAARLRRDLQSAVDMEHGRYGEFKVLVDGETVVDAGAWAAVGVLPTRQKVVDAVRARIGGDARGRPAHPGVR